MATFQPEKQQSSSVSPQRPRSVTWRGLFCSSIYLIAWIFLVLVLVGNVADKPGLRDTWFLKLDLSKIIPLSIPDAPLINSIAQSIGLHDFYQVGVWNFCEGYDDTGITHCSKPKPLYWFDPVEIIMSELLAGASIALPSEITNALRIARMASHWMFVLFLLGAILSFLAIFIVPFAVSSRPPHEVTTDRNVNAQARYHGEQTFTRFCSLPLLIFTFLVAFTTTVASIVATGMYTIFCNVFKNNNVNLNIQAAVGSQMMAFMWIASIFNLLGFIVLFGSSCSVCCRVRKSQMELCQSAGTSGDIGIVTNRNAVTSLGYGGNGFHSTDEENGATPLEGRESSDGGTLAQAKRRFRWRKTRFDL